MEEAAQSATAQELLSNYGIDGNWVDVLTFSVAVFLAVFSVLISLCKKTPGNIDSRSIFLDLMRGASLVPLSLFMLSPIFPHFGQAAAESNTMLLSLGAANGVFTLLSDWYQNT